MEKWPNFFIVGAPKAGTTSLHEYLSNIPGIFMSVEKEPNYFSNIIVSNNDPSVNPIRDKKKYLGLFKDVKDEKIIGEASPLYLADPEAPNLIHQVSPEAKILISLRDPVERLFSHYLMYKGRGRVSKSFGEIIKKELKNEIDYSDAPVKLYAGNYYGDVKKYLDIFGKDNVKIIIFEEFVKDTKNILHDILKFLGVTYSSNEFVVVRNNPYSVIDGKISQNIWKNTAVRKFVKKGIMPKSTRKFLREKIFLKKESKPQITEDDRKILQKYYFENVQKLKKLLGRELPWEGF